MLTDQQKKAVQLRCIDGLSVQQTAAVLGVHRCTIWRWSRKRDFRREWNRQLKEYVRQKRKDSGFYQQKAARRAELQRLEKKVNEAAAAVKFGNTAALDKAWEEYQNCLFHG